MSHPSTPTLTDLHLAVSQVKPAQSPTLLVSLRNTNTKLPVTFVTWTSPLDALLVQLGLVIITPPGSSVPIEMPTIMVKRRMPPPEDSLITLEPGEEVSRTVVLSERFVTPEQLRGDGRGGRPTVQLKGRWTAVWPAVRKEDLVGTKRLEALGGGGEEDGALSGEYESEPFEMDVDM